MTLAIFADLPALRVLARRCWPKEQHESQGKAEAHLRGLVRRGLEKDAARINSYKCRHCGAWHVGHVAAIVD